MERLRNKFLAELAARGADPDFMGQALVAFDIAAEGFEINERETGLIVSDGGLPEMAKTFLAVKHIEGCSDGTLYNYKKILEKFFATVRIQITDINANAIRVYMHRYQTEHGISLRSLDKIRCTLGSFFGWATDEGYLPRNPMRTVKPIRFEKKQRRSLTREELERLKRACITTRERAVVDVLYSTGCRASELINIKIDDIDFSSRRVQVIGKGRKERPVDLNDAAIISIQEYLADRKDDSPYLFVATRAPHNKFTRESLQKIVAQIAERAGIRNISPHILRHTFATLALQGGMDVQNVQRSLGHEQISTTMIYAETSDADVKAQHIRYVV